MIASKCPGCGRDLSIIKASGEQVVACPYCGWDLLSGSAPSRFKAETPAADETSALIVPQSTAAPAQEKAEVKTWAPEAKMTTAGKGQRTFEFLSPIEGTDALGRLAHYRVIRLLGEGGMGGVFYAEDTLLRRPVALKVMNPQLASKPALRQRFVREAQAMASIHSDHVVTVFEVGGHDAVPFLAMELLKGKPLDEWLEGRQRPTTAQIVDFALQLAKGLDAAHRCGVIHRDIKPSNIWIEEPTGRVKILDFGLALARQEASRLTQTGVVLGTPAYMAPEQADASPVDERCDLFSMGCVLYEFASGSQPFTGPSAMAVLKSVMMNDPAPLHQVHPDIPVALSNLIQRMLAKKPADRPESAAAVARELTSLDVVSAERPRQTSSGIGQQKALPSSWLTRRRLLIGAGFGALLLAPAGIVTYSFFGKKGQTGPIDDSHPDDKKTQRATAPGVTDTEILLGISAPFTGPARELGRDMEMGIQTVLKSVNDQGGIAGRKLTLLPLDDAYEPEKALANMSELFEQRKVFATIGNVGTPTAEKTVPYALDKRVLFFGAFTGAPLLRKDPPDRYVFNYRASYEEETAAIIKYLVENRKIRPEQIAVFAQQDGYGEAGFRGVAKMIRKFGHDPETIVRVGHPRNSVDVAAAAEEVLKHKDIQAIVMISTYRPAARFIQKLRDAKSTAILANVSFVGSTALAEELLQFGPTYAEGVIVSQVVPPIDSQASAVRTYREQLSKYYPNERTSFVSLEGYIAAAILVDALRMTGDNLTTDRLIESLESIHGLDLGIGTTIDYGPSKHQGSHKVWATVLDRSGRFQPLELD